MMPLHILKKKRVKLLSVRISTLDADLEFSVDYTAKAKSVFDLVCHTIGLRETWYFGLAFITINGHINWLKLDKKILDQNLTKDEDGFLHLKFLAKFYPEVVEEELIQEVTRHLFYLQYQQQILSEELHCEPEASILLASYAVQAKFGDYDPGVHQPGFLQDEVLLPQSVVDQFQTVSGQMSEEIIVWYAKHHGMTRDDAELEYLKIVQEFEMSGINYFKIKDGNDADLWLGVDAKSVSFYPIDDKLRANKAYQWSELADMSYSGNKFIIKLNSKMLGGGGGTLGRRRLQLGSTSNLNNNHSDDIFFITEDPDTNKLILDLCKGSHDLFMQRRRVDSMEIQHMKAQAKEEKARKQNERTRLKKQNELYIQLQNEKDEMEEKFKILQEENRAAGEILRKSEEAAELLSEKAKVAEEETMLLRLKVSNSEQEIQRLQVNISQLKETNHQLNQNFHKFDQLTKQLADTSRTKSIEATKLREELLTTQKALGEANMKLNLVVNQSMHHSPSASNTNVYTSTTQPHHSPMLAAMHNNNGSISHQPALSNPHNLHSSFSPMNTSSQYEVRSNQSNSEFSSNGGSNDVQHLTQEIEKEWADYQMKSNSIEQQLQNMRSEIEVLKVEDNNGHDSFASNNNSNISDQFAAQSPEVMVTNPRTQYYDGM